MLTVITKQIQALSWLLFGAVTLICENKLMTVALPFPDSVIQCLRKCLFTSLCS